MTDEEIIALFWDRKEEALNEASLKYDAYCRKISSGILKNKSDVDECINDTWLSAWDLIPPNKPKIFSAFLGKITRSLSLDVIRKNKAQKRGGESVTLALEELGECIPSAHDVERQVEQRELADTLNSFLLSISKDKRSVMVRRYWRMDSVGEIAKDLGMSQGTIKSMLSRTRKELKKYIEEVYS